MTAHGCGKFESGSALTKVNFFFFTISISSSIVPITSKI